MKKLLILLLMVATTFALGGLNVYAVNQSADYDYTLFDKQKYDLITGSQGSDINYSITNKILIANNSVDGTVYVANSDFHHVLFYNSMNIYLGYINTSTSDLELSTYLGYDVAGNSFEIPANAKKFALMSYNYNDTLALTAHTNPTIDAIAWEGLTYRDIFGDSLFGSGKTNLIDNGDFTGGTSGFQLGGSDISYTVVNEEANLLVDFIGSTGYLRNITLSVAGHTYYFASDIKSNGNARITMYNGSININDDYIDIGNWELLSILSTATAVTNFLVQIRDLNDDASTITFVDNVVLFDIYDLFNGYTMPDITEFETMLAYYKLYVDAPETVTYGDIYDGNIVINHDYASGTNDWAIPSGLKYIENDYLVRERDSLPSTENWNISNSAYLTPYHNHYYTYEARYTNIDSAILDVGFLNTNYTPINQVSFTTVSGLYLSALEPLATWNFRNDITTTEIAKLMLRDARIYDLVNIFGLGLEPDISTFETYLTIAIDPLLDSYTEYHTPVTILLVLPTYLYDDTPPVDSTLTDSIQGGLLDIGAVSTGLKIFFALAVMVGFAFGLGKITNSITAILLIEVVLFIVFALLGFFELWLVLLLGLVLVLLIFYNILH